MNWSAIETYFAMGVISLCLNGAFALWWLRRKRQEELPIDYSAFKLLVERRLNENEQNYKDIALAQIQTQRDMIGVRETVQWIKGRINGKGWQQP